MARLLASAGTRAVRVAHSGKLRAQQTAEVLAAALAPAAVLEIMTGLNPNDAVEPVARRVAGWTSDTILVGHLPFMGRLVARLSPATNAGRLPPSSRDRWSVWNKARRAAGPSRGW